MNEQIDVLAVLRVHGGLDDVAAAVAELIEKAEETRKFLTHKQWGSYHYMDGCDVYTDLRKHADMLLAALDRVGGGK